MQYTWQLALVLVPVYFIKHSVSCYIYYISEAGYTLNNPVYGREQVGGVIYGVIIMSMYIRELQSSHSLSYMYSAVYREASWL